MQVMYIICPSYLSARKPPGRSAASVERLPNPYHLHFLVSFPFIFISMISSNVKIFHE